MKTNAAPASDTLDEEEMDGFDHVIDGIMMMAGNDPEAATTIAAQVLQIFMIEAGFPKIIVNGDDGDPGMLAVLGDYIEDNEIPEGTVIH